MGTRLKGPLSVVNLDVPLLVEPPVQAENGVWILSRYADARKVLKARNVQPDRYIAERWTDLANRSGRDLSGLVLGFSCIPVNLDGEDHTASRLCFRQHLSAFLSPDPVPIAGLVDGVLDEVLSGSVIDGIRDVVEPFGVRRVAAGFGVPPESVVEMQSLYRQAFDGDYAIRPLAEIERQSRLADRVLEQARTILRRGTLSSAGLRPEQEDIALGTIVFSLNLGHDALQFFLGTILARLAVDAERQEHLRRARSEIARFVRESARMSLAVPSVYCRITEGRIELDGATLHPGDRIRVDLSRANRDPAVFEDPNRFDPARPAAPHLAFSSGPHTCMGVNTAQAIGEVFIDRLLDRFEIEARFDGLAFRRGVAASVYTEMPIFIKAAGRI